MPSYWIVRPGRERNQPVRVEGVEVDTNEKILSLPYKPPGSKLGKLMEVGVDEASHRVKSRVVEGDELERLPVDSILQITDEGDRFELLDVKPLEESSAIDPLTRQEKHLFGRVIDWAASGKVFEKEQVLRQTLVDVGSDKITTTNDLFDSLKKMGGEELELVRDALKANVLVLAKDIKGVSDTQFIFAMQLLNEIGDERDKETGGHLMEKIREGLGHRRADELLSEEERLNLADLVSTHERRELFRGIGALDKNQIIALNELTGAAERKMHEEKSLHGNETPPLAIQLKAACVRVGLKLMERKDRWGGD